MLALLVSLLAAVELPPSEQWLRVRTRHLVMFTDTDETRARRLASDSETLIDALTKASDAFDAPETPTRAFLFDSSLDADAYFRRAGVRHGAGGFTLRHRGGNVIVVDASGVARANKIAFHELVHDMLRNEQLPLWAEEGAAEYFSSAKIARASVQVGMPVREHRSLLRRNPVPVEEVFAIRAGSPDAATPLFYARSWAIVDTLLQLDRDAFFPFARELARGADPALALRTHYKSSIVELQNRTRYAGLSERPRIHVNERQSNFSEESASRADVIYELGRFLFLLDSARDEALRHFDAALALDPQHPGALAITRELADAAAAAAAREALAKELASTIASADTLARAGKVEDAARLLRELAPKLPPPQRAQLEQQIAKLDDVAENNRQVALYNDAVVAANAGDTKDARAMLRRLLAVAKDPELIEAAKRLEKELQ